MAAERVRAIEPNVELLARVTGEEELRDLAAMGVRHFADSRIEVAIELAQTVLGHVGVDADRVITALEGMHREARSAPPAPSIPGELTAERRARTTLPPC